MTICISFVNHKSKNLKFNIACIIRILAENTNVTILITDKKKMIASKTNTE